MEAPAASAVSHVRALSEHARLTLVDGLARSPTIVRLVAELNASDVIVFIDARIDPAIPTAETVLMTSAVGVRYVHVVMNPKMTLDERVEYLGHELQHAVEIARDASVIDGAAVRRRFAAIGRELGSSSPGDKSFETDGARLVSLAVRRELARGRRSGTTARGGSAPR